MKRLRFGRIFAGGGAGMKRVAQESATLTNHDVLPDKREWLLPDLYRRGRSATSSSAVVVG